MVSPRKIFQATFEWKLSLCYPETILSLRGPAVLIKVASTVPPISLALLCLPEGRRCQPWAILCPAADLHPVKVKNDPYRARGPMQGLKGPQNRWVVQCNVREHGKLKWAHSRSEWVRLGGSTEKCPLFGPFSPKGPFQLFSYRYLTESVRLTSAYVLTFWSCKHCLPY